MHAHAEQMRCTRNPRCGRQVTVRSARDGVLEQGAGDAWKQKVYKGKASWVPYAELALAGYFTFMSLYAVAYGLVGTLPFISLFLWGFLYTSGMSLAQRFEWLIPREQEA